MVIFKKYFFHNLIFLIFHLITWKLISFFEIQYGIFFIFQYFVYLILLKLFNVFDIGISIISLPLIILYLVTVISFIDRSITVNMLMIYEIENSISKEYLLDNDRFDSKNIIETRLKEQVDSGLIDIKNENIYITKRGEILSRIYKWLAGYYKY